MKATQINTPAITTTSDPLALLNVDDQWLELQLYNGYRIWHIIFFVMTVVFTLGTLIVTNKI